MEKKNFPLHFQIQKYWTKIFLKCSKTFWFVVFFYMRHEDSIQKLIIRL